MKRKIVRVGASLCILLPKDIIRMMGWDFGDEIDLILDEENERVILRNPREEVKKKQSYLEDFDSFLSEYKDILNVVDAD
jgi:antitoxin component of MazEF toxin-antitoxin module